MNKWGIAAIVIVFIIFYAFFVGHQTTMRENKELRDYIRSKGKTTQPSLWKGEIGKGI